MKHWIACLGTLSWLASCLAVQAQDMNALLNKVPAKTNAVAYVNIGNLLRTNMGQEEKWKEKIELDYISGFIPCPPETQSAIKATRIELGDRSTSWEVGLFNVGKALNFYEMAKSEKGYEGTIGGGVPCVQMTSRNAYFIQFNKEILGVASPAQTQEISTWVKHVKGATSPSLKPSLKNSLEEAARLGQIAMAIDLEDAVDEATIKNNVRFLNSLKGKDVDFDKFAKLLTSIKGARLSVRVESDATATMFVSFNDSPQSFAEVIPDVTKEILGNMGFPMDQMGKFDFSVSSDGVAIRGKLNQLGLFIVFSMLHPPVVPPSAMAAQSAGDPGAPNAASTKRYMMAVDKCLSDMANMVKQASDYNSAAALYENYAKRMERLPRSNVDPELQNSTARICLMVRSVASSLRGARVDYDVLETNKQSTYWVDPGYAYAGAAGGWGWGGYAGAYYQPPSFWVNNNYQEMNVAQAKVVAESTKTRDKILADIMEETGKIKQKMSGKYNISF